MNRVILSGRLANDPEVRFAQDKAAVANYSIAVDRKYKKDGEASADFIRCISFGKTAEVIEKYVHKGHKVLLSGRIQTGSYTNKEGTKVYTTDVIVEEIEFLEKKESTGNPAPASSDNVAPMPSAEMPSNNGFMNIPAGFEELPFN